MHSKPGRADILGVLNPKQGKKSIKSRKAAYCIGQIRDEKAVPALIKLLKEDDESVKLAAVEALAAMNIKEAESEFEKMLNIEQKALTPKEMRKIMDTETKDMKSKILSHLVAGNKGKFVPKVLGILTEAANQEYFKWQETLGVGFSANDFTTKSGFDIYAAVNLAGILNEKKAIPALEKILKHEEGTIRHAAAVALWKITGKVYKYNKSLHVQGEDEYWIKRIKDEYDRFKAKKADFNKQRASGRMSEEIYRFYMDHETEELLKKHTLERLRKEAQEQGYLLEYNSVDEILEEIKKNPEKYEWR